MFEVKEFELSTVEGKRNVRICNGIRSQLYDKVVELLEDAGFDVTEAANKDIAFPVAVDANTNETYYVRLALSLSSKPLDSKVVKKAKAKTDEVEIPVLFE